MSGRRRGTRHCGWCRRLGRSALRSASRLLLGFRDCGAIYLQSNLPFDPDAEPEPSAPGGAAPLRAHPERLVCSIPPTPDEELIWRALDEVWAGLPGLPGDTEG